MAALDAADVGVSQALSYPNLALIGQGCPPGDPPAAGLSFALIL